MIAIFLWCACSNKEDSLEPSRKDRNWMEIADEPGELNQWKYQLYKEYGIPVFVNDTIGSEQRGYDTYGQPIIYYEMLWPGYTLTSFGGSSCNLSSDTAGMIKAVKMIYELVAPNLFKGEEYKPKSLLLCDLVYNISFSSYGGDSTFTSYDVYTGLKTTTLSICGMKDMELDELEDFAARIVGKVTVTYISEYFESELDTLAGVSKEGLDGKNPFGQSIDYKTSVYPDGWKEEKLYSMGFLHDQYHSYKWKDDRESALVSSKTPDAKSDIEDYVGAAMVYSESEFEQLYGKYDKMMRKFRFMKDFIARYRSEVLKE